MHVLDYIMDRMSRLFRFNNIRCVRAYSIMFHVAGLSLRDLSERYCMTMASRESVRRWFLERLGLRYRYQRFGLRNAVERFFGYLKERTMIFHHKMSIRNHVQGFTNLELFLNLFTIYYQATRRGGG
jgi:hypothetical protein